MTQSLSAVDWLVISTYLVFLVAFAYWLSRSQQSSKDYYIADRQLGAWPVAISIMATQCSTSSILGAPAFVAFAAEGGLVWLQYELAVPLAMIGLMLFLIPVFRRLKLVSVYSYLEQRFDLKTRLTMSALFLFLRAFASSVTVYSISIVIELITGLSFFWSVLLLGAFTVVYDVLGGIRGVIYSDVIQLFVLVVILLIVFFLLVENSNGLSSMLDSLEPDRRKILNFSEHGLGDGNTFGFWPMLIGGSFLYMSYYGCDQSQVQRTLSTRNIDESNQALFLNGLLRFPLVLLYCLVGVGIGAFAIQNPEFISSLPKTNGVTELNLAVPHFMITNLPNGLVGLSMVALFAAAMSSLDSVLNSLSATTMEDFVTRFYPVMDWKENTELWCSRGITAGWGVITLVMSFFVGGIASTVLEAINQIGSMANGSILAVFALGLLTHRTNGSGVIIGLVTGILVNASLWAFAPLVSWLWWNVVGFCVTFVIGWGLGLVAAPPSNVQPEYSQNLRMANKFTSEYLVAEANIDWGTRCAFMVAWFLILFVLLWMLGG